MNTLEETLTKLQSEVISLKRRMAQLEGHPERIPKPPTRTLLPAENREASFETMHGDFQGVDLSTPIEITKKLAREHLQGPKPLSEAIFFGGRAGIGKTTLAAAVVKLFEDAGKRVLFLQPEQIFDQFLKRKDYGKLKDVDLVVLDDFNGATQGIEKMFLRDVIPQIHSQGGQLLLVTSNMTFDSFMKNCFPGATFHYDKDGKVVSKDTSRQNDTQRIERRVTDLFEGRTFFFP